MITLFKIVCFSLKTRYVSICDAAIKLILNPKKQGDYGTF